MDASHFVGKFGNWEKSKKKISMKRCFAMNAHVDVGEADQKWMGHVIATHDRDIGLVR